ncbi:unnamed protein product [Aspergillus oryzae]|uniref:Unnamed protein product n=1 Tax=Aspergillus oryzae var. brunneus TaxID=332754 RepID=A0ABQ6KGA0_ASPOZ|nr:unnamed protein product [Aspergillus oryzae]GMF83798.1 unnamed protein product [Aspergillus oryzae]GMG06151.1 unnamed protein product [Aspergillus oryzae]GMG42737.1 unnamed protein product [Aspergillus oryzae var. brunneus]
MATGIRRGECLSGDLRERAGKSESGYAPKLWTVGSRYKCRATSSPSETMTDWRCVSFTKGPLASAHTIHHYAA